MPCGSLKEILARADEESSIRYSTFGSLNVGSEGGSKLSAVQAVQGQRSKNAIGGKNEALLLRAPDRAAAQTAAAGSNAAPDPGAARTAAADDMSASLPVVAIGKIEDLFAGRGVTKAIHTASDDEGMTRVEEQMRRERDNVWTPERRAAALEAERRKYRLLGRF